MKNFITLIIFIIILVVVVISIPNDTTEYIYECTDYQGNIIYCNKAYESKGGMFGIMEDGTKLVITSYKEVEK